MFSVLSLTAQDWEPLDLGFKKTATSAVYDIKVHPISNELYACGNFTRDGYDNLIGGFTRFITEDDIWDISFNEMIVSCTDFIFFEDEIYANGEFTIEGFQDNGSLHLRVNESWEYIENGPKGNVFETQIFDDNLYLIGSFNTVGTNPSYGIASYDGETFDAFPTDNSSEFKKLDDIEIFQGDKYIVGQNMIGSPFYAWENLAKIENGNLVEVHSDFSGIHFQTWVYSLEQFGDYLYIAGKFFIDDGYSGNGIQRFDGINMFEVGGGVNFDIYDMQVYKDELYVVGIFNRIGEGSDWLDFENGTPCNGVAKWSGQEWTCLLNEEIDGQITTLEIHDDILYIGGNFSHIGNDSSMSLIARKRLEPSTNVNSLELNLYPNPANEQITLSFNTQVHDVNVTMFNAIGQLVYQDFRQEINQEVLINTDFLSQGLYVIQIITEGTNEKRKIIIEK